MTNLTSLQALARKQEGYIFLDYRWLTKRWCGVYTNGYANNIEVDAPTLTKCVSSLYRKVKESV